MFLDINMPGWYFLDEFKPLAMKLIAKTEICMLTTSIIQQDKDKTQQYDLVNGFVGKPLFMKDTEECFGGEFSRLLLK